MTSRILCVNCGLCVNRIARHIVLEQDTRVVSFIAERISPRIITDCDHICQACLEAIMKRVNQIIHGEISSDDIKPPGSSNQVVGHSKVCFMCGRSILRRQSDLILRNNPSQLHQIMATIVMNSTKTQEITSTDRVCHLCWMKTRRKALRIKTEPTDSGSVDLPSVDLPSVDFPSVDLPSSPTSKVKEEPLQEHDIETPEQPPPAMEQSEVTENVDLPDQTHDKVDTEAPNPSASSAPFQSVWIPEDPSVVKQNQGTITLPNYRRAPNTAAHCIFANCTSCELHRVSDDLRVKLIIDHHFYLPVHARVCSDHLLRNSWDTLYNSKISNATFTVEQVEQIFSFINFNKSKVIDFSDPLKIDDHLFQYWLGLTKEKFSNLLNEVPQIKDMRRGVTGLVAYLIKLRNGDSDERLGNLMGISRRTLERYMKDVKEKLKLKFVSGQNISNENLLILTRISRTSDIIGLQIERDEI